LDEKMNGRKLFKLFGIEVRIHPSWWFIFILLSWSLSAYYFPEKLAEYSWKVHWAVGVSAAVLLFLSVLLHEVSHSLVARREKVPVESITLFFFGGVAGITKEVMKPWAEFRMALAGPLFSFMLSGLFFLLVLAEAHPIITVVALYISQLNLILACFNLLPAFPLDGGRVFRALLYAGLKDIRKATWIAASVGRFFSIVMAVWGLITMFFPVMISDFYIGGFWFVVLGIFLYFVSGSSYEQVVVREILSGSKVKEMMKKQQAVDGEMKFSDFLKRYKDDLYEAYLVESKGFVGILDLRQASFLPKKMQEITKLKQVAISLEKIKPLSLKDDAYEAFKQFLNQGLGMLPILEKKKVVGIVSRQAVMNRLMIGLKFEDGNVKHQKIVRKLRM
jgi:Zn-dependent protease/CBS domain-containing protein